MIEIPPPDIKFTEGKSALREKQGAPENALPFCNTIVCSKAQKYKGPSLFKCFPCEKLHGPVTLYYAKMGSCLKVGKKTLYKKALPLQTSPGKHHLLA